MCWSLLCFEWTEYYFVVQKNCYVYTYFNHVIYLYTETSYKIVSGGPVRLLCTCGDLQLIRHIPWKHIQSYWPLSVVFLREVCQFQLYISTVKSNIVKLKTRWFSSCRKQCFVNLRALVHKRHICTNHSTHKWK